MKGTEQILMSGGDSRLSVDTSTGLNRFGCAPGPRPEALSFGSSTASSISPRSFRHVQDEYEHLLKLPSPHHRLDSLMEILRADLRRVLGLADTGTEIVFSPSGTDATLQALTLVRALTGSAPLDCILPASDETGTGVPLALSGRHFSDCTAEGVAVVRGEKIDGLGDDVTLVSIPRRCPDGTLRSPACLDQEVWETVERSAAAGHQVLLQVMDCSKLGASSPSLECRRRIQDRFGASVHFVVDACQMRLSRTRLQSYLTQGHLVLISGSKFFTGPPFSGALLIPASLAGRLKSLRRAATGLRDYTSRCAWPQEWTALRATLPDRTSFGQYFRWTAALAEMCAYFAVPEEFRCRTLRQFAVMATSLIEGSSPDCQLLANGAEPETRTIFPFVVRRAEHWMSYTDSVLLYNALNQDCSASIAADLTDRERALAATLCHIGQPVRIPLQNGKDTGALRICADARMVSQRWSQYQNEPQSDGLECCRQEIAVILAKTVLLARYLE